VAELDAEDAKLLTLARAARARTGADESAAIRDSTGRTYAAAAVALPSLRLSGMQAAVAAALSSGSSSFEAAVVVSNAGEVSEADQRLLADIGDPTVHVVIPDGVHDQS
jgi:hypothetical protein